MKGALLAAAFLAGAGTLTWWSISRAEDDGRPAAAREHGAAPSSAIPARAASPELEAARARIVELEETVRHLRAELGAAEEARIERERAFLSFTQGISRLGSLAGATVPTFATQVPEDARASEVTSATAADGDAHLANAPPGSETASAPESAHDAVQAQRIADAARSREVFLGLRALLAAEQVRGIDLLESGNLQDGFTGPVVMRMLDERGRPMGALTAERLHLEASRAARMVTIVLEQGCERRDGVRTPFEGGPPDSEGRGGRRRIVLADCDPRAWIEALPELFPAADLEERFDDGLYDLRALRATLNTLFHAESGAGHETGTGTRATSGWYRLQGLSGVQGTVLRDIALDQLDREGRLERRFFADRMVILRETQGLQILLEGGSQVRGDEKTPFLDGRYRIFLPRAPVKHWEKAGLPGLAPAAPELIPPAPVPSAPAAPAPAPRDV